MFDADKDYEHIAMIEKVAGKFPYWMVIKCEKEIYRKFDFVGNEIKFKIERNYQKSVENTKRLEVSYYAMLIFVGCDNARG